LVHGKSSILLGPRFFLVGDILNFISNCGIDPAGEEFTVILNRYANDET